MFPNICKHILVGASGDMVYFDGFQTWGQCARCGTIQAIRYYPHRSGYLVPLCSDCCEDGAELLARGRSVVRPTKSGVVVEHPFLAEDYEVDDY